MRAGTLPRHGCTRAMAVLVLAVIIVVLFAPGVGVFGKAVNVCTGWVTSMNGATGLGIGWSRMLRGRLFGPPCMECPPPGPERPLWKGVGPVRLGPHVCAKLPNPLGVIGSGSIIIRLPGPPVERGNWTLGAHPLLPTVQMIR